MDIGSLISLLVYVVIIGAILFVVWWGVSQIPMAEPIATVVKVVFVLIVCLLAISLLLQLLPGGGSFRLFPR
jgi:hypothetical protein